MQVTNYRLTIDEIIAMAEKRVSELIAEGNFPHSREILNAMGPVERKCYVLFMIFTKRQRARFKVYSKLGISREEFDFYIWGVVGDCEYSRREVRHF